MSDNHDIDDVFNNAGGGGGAPSFKWPEDASQYPKRVPVIGTMVKGEIVDLYMTVVKLYKKDEPKLNRRGETIPQVNITLQTELRNWEGCEAPFIDYKDESKGTLDASEDTGLRRLYCKYLMLDAVAKSIKASDQKTGGPKLGAKLAVRVSGLKPTSEDNPLPEYEARYDAPTALDKSWDTAVAPQSVPATAPADAWSTASKDQEPPF